MIQGGWEFVGAAYAIAYGTLALYGYTLWRRVWREPVPVPVPKSRTPHGRGRGAK